MRRAENPDIEELINRIAALEVANESLQRQVTELKREKEQKKPNREQSTVENHNRPSTRNAEIYLDRHGRNIKLGDRVYIITSGAHTDRSRRGVVNGFDWHRNRVYILDEGGITQERVPKNLRLESSRNH